MRMSGPVGVSRGGCSCRSGVGGDAYLLRILLRRRRQWVGLVDVVSGRAAVCHHVLRCQRTEEGQEADDDERDDAHHGVLLGCMLDENGLRWMPMAVTVP